ncbi:MAG: Alanine-tRNA ligase [Parcubacteria group bacterium GW2011_GWE2_39_37]|uniref:Alanine--tRNA ligase n=1 Tax=Candidatus Falkowbacteria bacterium GW2011_GWF2_39_8 TaxID=1618642 RepID=A0A0G0T626_9BACT|nr:MAG: Alanine-tRNA ligase [Parcubacteria group bacterium GW2011_GWE2_39_37]KKR33277.1 MAG: Alanine-tRNA ligase [Candidatus Falkowbacteria bacterium GW2011_GWF2_39_8]
MTAQQLRQKYLDFFKSKGHTIIPSASLVPHETDASTLFTTAGMHPLVPYLLGAEHPGGKRVVNVQKCVRTGDIDDVGDNRHLTFFEMMGNWSFGDYFKEEAIKWSFEFLTSPEWLGLDPKRLYVTTFKGENGIPRDEKAIEVWKETFAQAGMNVTVAGEDEMINNDIRIIPLGTDDNFWIAGATGPCGGDTEMFYDTRPEEGALEGKFSDLVGNYRLIEIWNDVFMEFNKTADGQYIKLEKPNVDTGMGVERTLMVLSGESTVFETELFQPIFEKIETLTHSKYSDNEETKRAFRIIADHIKTATLMISDGVTPSNTAQGYVLRRIIRRAIRYGKLIGMQTDFSPKIAEVVINMYGHFYQELNSNTKSIFEELKKEEDKFRLTLENGIKEFEKLKHKNADKTISGEDAFNLYQSYGFPFEITKELALEADLIIDEAGFNKELEKHQELSRTASAGMFKGGLADTEGITIKYHTATHLLLAALREILGPETFQKGSNITAERLRFDFNYDQKLTPEQIKQVEDLVNQKIGEKIPVELSELPKGEALNIAKVSFDPSKYGDIVKVYKIGDFSIELCGGPHVNNTEELGRFKIQKEEASSAGVRRIKAVLE